MKGFIKQLEQIIAQRADAATCTVVATQGSAPLKAGAKMLVWKSGHTYGTIGGGELERKVVEQAVSTIDKRQPAIFDHNLVKDHQMCCGGKVKVYIEPVKIPWPVYLFGGGHVSQALAEHMRPLEDFEITVIDDRPGIFDGWNANGLTLINKQAAEVLPTLSWGDHAFAVIFTYSHPLDREILAFCLQKQTAYTGMIGSKRKAAMTRKLFLEQAIATDAQLDAVDMPIGIDIGGQSTQEIAISIVAKLISIKNKKHTPPINAPKKKTAGDSSCLSSEVNIYHQNKTQYEKQSH